MNDETRKFQELARVDAQYADSAGRGTLESNGLSAIAWAILTLAASIRELGEKLASKEEK